MPKVTIVQHRLLHYRLSLFEGLRAKLNCRGVELQLVHGQASRAEISKRDTGVLAWATVIENRYLSLFGKDLLWQRLPSHLLESDLIVAMQENKILSNYFLQFFWRGRNRRFAFWGHGRNLQSTAPKGIRERWKRFFVGRVDWWFAYTSSTVAFLKQVGFDERHITCLNNAVDTTGFSMELRSVTDFAVSSELASVGISGSARIGLYCGSLYSEKRLQYLVNEAEKIRVRLGSFHLVIIGDGPMMDDLRVMSKGASWIHILGSMKGYRKAVWHKAASLLLCPGALGLQVVDSFAAALPIVTLKSSLHGPEAAYLEHERNALILDEFSSTGYAQEVLNLLGDEQRLQAMRRFCLDDADKYSIENMIESFSKGICDCLGVR